MVSIVEYSMNTAIMKFLTAGVLGASLFGATGTPAVPTTPKASNKAAISVAAGVGFATSSKAVVAPGKLTVKPGSGDEITQLNSLQIQGISGNIVTAARMQKVVCVAAPCNPVPARLFTINVNASTILLFRNRTRATLADFAVGDKINVYGFIDGNTLDALIMRDLDKPQLPIKTELHNMQITWISGNILTVQYHFDCKGQICPMMGTATSINGNSSDKMMPMIYPMPREVVVGADTKIVDRNGNKITFADLKIGDLLDVYGTYKGADPNSAVNAQTIRDNSMPVKSSGALSISSLSGPGKLVVNQAGEWKIQVTGGDQNSLRYEIVWGDETYGPRPETMLPFQKENVASIGTFTHAYLYAGVYKVQIIVTDVQGATATATASVYVYSGYSL